MTAVNFAFIILHFAFLYRNKRQKRHMSSMLECFGYHPLMFRAGACAVVAQYFGVGRHKAAQGLRIFIVNGADFVGTKIALFLYLGL